MFNTAFLVDGACAAHNEYFIAVDSENLPPVQVEDVGGNLSNLAAELVYQRELIQDVEIFMVSINPQSREALFGEPILPVNFSGRTIPNQPKVTTNDEEVVFGKIFCCGNRFVLSFPMSILA